MNKDENEEMNKDENEEMNKDENEETNKDENEEANENYEQPELEGVLGSIFLGSIVGIFFGFLIGYYKENYLLGFLIGICVTFISSAYFEYFIFENIVQINYYRVLIGLPPIDPFLKGASKGFKSVGRSIEKGAKSAGKGIADGVKSATDAISKLGDAAIKKMVRAILEPMFKGVKGTFDKLINDILLKPVKKLEGLLKKMQDGIKKASSSIVLIGKKIAEYMQKIPKIFASFGIALNNSIVLPMLNVFKSFGLMLLGVLELLFVIIKKIISLPRCIGVYLFHGASFFFNNVFLLFLPNWLREIIKLMIKLINIFLYVIYTTFYIMVYPLRLFGWDLIGDLINFFKSDCMKISFMGPINNMKEAAKGLVPKFKPFKIIL